MAKLLDLLSQMNNYWCLVLVPNAIFTQKVTSYKILNYENNSFCMNKIK